MKRNGDSEQVCRSLAMNHEVQLNLNLMVFWWFPPLLALVVIYGSLRSAG